MRVDPSISSLVPATDERLNALVGLLPELAKTLRDMQSGELEINSKSTDVDLVTRADWAAENLLLNYIRERFDGDAILSEEGGGITGAVDGDDPFQSSASGLLWVLDPLDGTVNYAHGLPIYCVSIALLDRSGPIGGLIHAPALGLTYRAVRNHGATRNQQPIHVNEFASLREGLVATGFPYNRAEVSEGLAAGVECLLRKAGGVRRLGSAALDISWVASGEFAGYYETGLKPWDTAAATLIAAEAGAHVTNFGGEPMDVLRDADCVVSNGAADLHKELLDCVRPMNRA